MSRDIRGQPRNGQNIFLTVEFDQIDLAILYIELNLFCMAFQWLQIPGSELADSHYGLTDPRHFQTYFKSTFCWILCQRALATILKIPFVVAVSSNTVLTLRIALTAA